MNLYRLTTTAKQTDPWTVPPRADVRRVVESAASDPDGQRSLRQQLNESGAGKEPPVSANVELAPPLALAQLVEQLRGLGDYADRLLKRLDGPDRRHPYRPINEEA